MLFISEPLFHGNRRNLTSKKVNSNVPVREKSQNGREGDHVPRRSGCDVRRAHEPQAAMPGRLGPPNRPLIVTITGMSCTRHKPASMDFARAPGDYGLNVNKGRYTITIIKGFDDPAIPKNGSCPPAWLRRAVTPPQTPRPTEWASPADTVSSWGGEAPTSHRGAHVVTHPMTRRARRRVTRMC